MKSLSVHPVIHKNKLTTIGSIFISEEIGKNDIIANLDFKQCPTNDSCSEMTSIQVKAICNYLVGKSLFGNKFGEYFTPSVKCPAKPGTYKFNLSLNMMPLTRLPLAKFRTWNKLILFDKLPNNRKRPLLCYETIVSMKD